MSSLMIKPKITISKTLICEDEHIHDSNCYKYSNESLQTVVSADTSNIVEINLYDYSTNINDKYINNHKYPGFQQDGGTILKVDTLKNNSFNFGNNITTDLHTYITNVTTNNPGPINKIVNNANSPLSGVIKSSLGSDGYPAIKDENNEISLKYLFSNNTYATKVNTENINGLFQYNNETGAYTFDSRKNHAEWNSSNNTFTLYKQIITSNFLMYPFGNFLPFNNIETQATKASTINRDYFKKIEENAKNKANNSNDFTYKNAYNTLSTRLNEFVRAMDTANNNNKSWDAGKAATEYFKAAKLNKTITTESLSNIYSINYDEATNFFFGLEIKMNFIQPKGGLTGNDGNQPMIFDFSGDDDVLVYIDDVLFLDLSGIHRHVGGKIDFVEGKVYYYDLDPNTGDTTSLSTVISPNPITFEQILGNKTNLNSNGTFTDYSSHSFKLYYMERGSGSGVMKMNFNFPLIEKNSITVTKELDSSDKSLLGNPDFSFQILKANNNIKTNEPFIPSGTKYDILDTSGIKIGDGIVLTNGIFTLKAGQTALFKDIEENLGNYYVREILDPTWINQYNNITVNGKSTIFKNDITLGTETFFGYESDIEDISNGHASFVYINGINIDKYGGLQITKNLINYNNSNSTKDFDFYVTLDGNALPVGTNYVVNKTNTKQILEPGIITIKAKEYAEIINILAGTKFEIFEKITGINGYRTNYNVNGVDVFDNSVSGYIDNTSIDIVVTNNENGSDLEIPIIKTIKNPNGNSYNYEFELVEVTDYTGETQITIGPKLVTSFDVVDTKEDKFILKYSQPNYENVSTKKHYYKITEIPNNNDINTKYDKRTYVIEVTINNNEETFTTTISKVWVDGKEVIDKKIEFKNQLLTNLTISKEIKNDEDNEDIFEFKLEIKNNETPLTGEYEYKIGRENIDKITFDNNGEALIKLKDKEEVTIYGLPYGATYHITELIKDDYSSLYQINSDEITNGNTATGILEKNNIIKFINIKLFDLIVEKIWNVSDGNNIPNMVTIELLKNNEVIDVITLNNENNWTHTWEKIEKSDEYSIREINIPTDYTVSYRKENNKFIVTNTKTLIQTGQKLWFINTSLALGTIFIVIGFICKKRKKHE